MQTADLLVSPATSILKPRNKKGLVLTS